MRTVFYKRLPLLTVLFWLVVAILLICPVQFGLAYLNEGSFVWRGFLASLGLWGLFIASSWLVLRARWTWAIIAGVFALAFFFLRMLFFGVTRFSGRGFDTGFFLSLSGEAVSVAWHQYFYMFALFGIGAAIILAGFIYYGRRVHTPPAVAAVVLALVSLAAIAGGYRTAPAWQLGSAAYDWYHPTVKALSAARMAMWRKSPLIHVDLVAKQALHAHAATPPKNLIFLYIESGGIAMAPASQYPGLMPNLKRMIAQHSFVPHIHASSYVTIEGIVNTQCGTLFPFAEGNESMAGFDHMLNEMPCLGDVLHAAGYQQSYLGGSGLRFAGKGRFLRLHGYNKVMGLRQWEKLGLKQRPGTWGLSDVDLFKQSFIELKRLKASGRPWNLTMLTIGMHPPGFFYKECKPYGDSSNRYLNAAHCSDQLIGRWVAKLKSGGWLDKNTILVITGDHQVFPNPKMDKLFGDAAVANHRLPFIVMGQDLPKPVLHDGAGYDIAPTVLDLLGVKSNARFALGRSLLRHDRKLDYYPSRYIDMLGEHRYTSGNKFHCDPADTTRIPGEQPLSRCERTELFTILAAQAATYSAPLPRMDCHSARPLQVSIPAVDGAPMKFKLTGNEQAGRFTWKQRHVSADKPGLYLLTLDKDGVLVRRRYAPPSGVAKAFAAEPKMSAAVLVAAWRPGAQKTTLPGWLQQLGVEEAGGVWVFRLRGRAAPVLQRQVSLKHTLAMTPRQCKSLLSTN